MESPWHKHDSYCCEFLGRHGKYDLYFCPQGGHPTVIARFGSDGPDYTSGLPAIGQHDALAEAAKRAVMAGYISPDRPTGNADGKTVAAVLGAIAGHQADSTKRNRLTPPPKG